MRTLPPWARKTALACIRGGLFILLFVPMQWAIASVLLRVSRADAFTLDTTSTLLAALFCGWLLLAVLEHKPPAALGFDATPGSLKRLGGGIVLGSTGLVVAALLMVVVGVVRFSGDDGTVGDWVLGVANMMLVLLIPAAAEEALFRGYAYQKLVEGFGAVAATIAASAVFAMAHAHNPSVNGFALCNIFLAGVVLSFAYLRTRSLWFATGVHLGWNWCMAALLDLPVSGLELFDAPLYEPHDRGPAWISGGAFGPEAGLAGVIALMIVCWGTWWLTRKRAWQA